MSFAPGGARFVGSKSGEVYAVQPNDAALIVTRALNMPVGLDFFEEELYISSIFKIVKIENVLADLQENPAPRPPSRLEIPPG